MKLFIHIIVLTSLVVMPCFCQAYKSQLPQYVEVKSGQNFSDLVETKSVIFVRKLNIMGLELITAALVTKYDDSSLVIWRAIEMDSFCYRDEYQLGHEVLNFVCRYRIVAEDTYENGILVERKTTKDLPAEISDWQYLDNTCNANSSEWAAKIYNLCISNMGISIGDRKFKLSDEWMND